MSPESPPRPSKRTSVALAVVALVTFLYSILVTAQILLWFVLVGIAVGLYLTYLLIVAAFRLVAAVERVATAAEVDSGIRTVAEARASAQTDNSDATGVHPSETRAPENYTPEASAGAPGAGSSTDDPDADGSAPDGDAADPDDTTSAGSNGSDDPDGRSDAD